jgi:2-iminobutanoate/2-iminopropanoate deaminase
VSETRRSPAAPSAIGPYSQAIVAGGLVFVSGCIPLDPASMDVVTGGIAPQAKQALANLKAVVEASGSAVGKVVKTTVRPVSLPRAARRRS